MSLMNDSTNLVNIVGDLHQINFSIDSFKDIRSENFLYVDKSKLIEDILNYDKRKVILFYKTTQIWKIIKPFNASLFF